MAYYNIAKVAAGDTITRNVYVNISNSIDQERARRSQSALTIAVPSTGSNVPASIVNTLGYYIGLWTGGTYSVSQGQVITADQINALIDGLNSAGAQVLTVLFPDSFTFAAPMVDAYGWRYLYGTATVTHTSSAVLSNVSANVANLYSYTANPGVGVTANSQGQSAEYFDVAVNYRRGCQNGNDQEHWLTLRFRALPGSYESFLIAFSSNQWGC